MNKLQRLAHLAAVILTSLLITTSCSDADSVYSNITARFSYRPVDAVPNLYRACTVPGQFCKITDPIGSNGRYKVESPGSNADYIIKTRSINKNNTFRKFKFPKPNFNFLNKIMTNRF